MLYDQTKHENSKDFCDRCLHSFKWEDLLEKPTPDCKGINQAAVAIEMPEPVEKIMFNNYRKQLKAPYIIYADFDSITQKIQGQNLDPKKSGMQNTAHHEACGYSFIVLICDGETKPPVIYSSPNAANHFLKTLQKEKEEIRSELENPKEMIMTSGDKASFRKATHCHICNKPLYNEENVYMIKCEITVILQESTEGRLTTTVIFNCVSEMSSQ